MEKIKSYPLQFTESDLKKLKEIAELKGITLKEFIINAIYEKVERIRKGE